MYLLDEFTGQDKVYRLDGSNHQKQKATSSRETDLEGGVKG
jgi:hypothetical protein